MEQHFFVNECMFYTAISQIENSGNASIEKYSNEEYSSSILLSNGLSKYYILYFTDIVTNNERISSSKRLRVKQ